MSSQQMINEPPPNNEPNPNNNAEFPPPISNNEADNSLNNPMRPLGPFAINGTPRSNGVNPGPGPLPPVRVPSTTSLNREMVLSNFIAQCTACRQMNQAIARCYDCNSYLCQRCEQLHVRSKNTTKHSLYYWTPVSWASAAVRFSAGNVAHEQMNGNVPEQPVTVPQLPPHARAVGAERRSIGENSHSMSEPGSSQESSVQELLYNIMSSSYGSERSVQLVPSGPSSLSRSDPDHVSPRGDSLENQGAPLDPLQCPTHLQAFWMQCSQCLLPVCITCITTDHANHHVTPLPNIRDLIAKMIGEVDQMTLRMRFGMDRMQYAADQIEYRAFEVAVKIKTVFKKLIALMEGRETELMCTINQNLKVKTSIIYRQMENIQEAYSNLNETLAILTNANTIDANREQQMLAVQVASKTIGEIKEMHLNLIPLENDSMEFKNPTDELLLTLSNIGEIVLQTPPLNRSVALCNVPSVYFRYPVGPAIDSMPFSKSRPIHGCGQIVAIRNYGRLPQMTIGNSGNGPRQFCRPWGIAFNRFGQLVVADRSNNRIQVFNPNGEFFIEFGTRGSGKGQLERPSAVAVSPNDDMVVCDKDNHRIQVFNRYGQFLHTFGEKGSKIGQFMYPWDVACNKQGQILVSDTRNRRVQLFEWTGVFISLFGEENNKTKIPRLFDSPRGVAFDPKGNLMVTDFNMHRLVIINPQNGAARLVGREGYARGCFNRPQGIVCDDRGWFVVADSKNCRCQIFNDRAELMWTVGMRPAPRPRNNTAIEPQLPGEIDRPAGVCIDSEGHLYVVDFGSERVVVW